MDVLRNYHFPNDIVINDVFKERIFPVLVEFVTFQPWYFPDALVQPSAVWCTNHLRQTLSLQYGLSLDARLYRIARLAFADSIEGVSFEIVLKLFDGPDYGQLIFLSC